MKAVFRNVLLLASTLTYISGLSLGEGPDTDKACYNANLCQQKVNILMSSYKSYTNFL